MLYLYHISLFFSIFLAKFFDFFSTFFVPSKHWFYWVWVYVDNFVENLWITYILRYRFCLVINILSTVFGVFVRKTIHLSFWSYFLRQKNNIFFQNVVLIFRLFFQLLSFLISPNIFLCSSQLLFHIHF